LDEISSNAPTVIVISGPTASGKTALGISLARLLRGEIINADAVQVYKHFDIGSSKPDFDYFKDVPHHLISICDPSESFNAGKFVKLADEKVRELTSNDILPIVVGGTGLYIRSLLCGLAPVGEISKQAKANVFNREQSLLNEGMKKIEASKDMHKWLETLDPESASAIHENDISRIRRALMVAISTGDSIKKLQSRHLHRVKTYNALVVILLPDRELLYKEVNKRVDEMLASGLVDEVRNLKEQFDSSCKAFSSIGYSQVVDFLDGKYGEEKMRELICRATRQFAKRQYTWWKNQPNKLGWKRRYDIEKSCFISSDISAITPQLKNIIEEFVNQNKHLVTDSRRQVEFFELRENSNII
jgi:tRNA dimethylallyltransferase